MGTVVSRKVPKVSMNLVKGQPPGTFKNKKGQNIDQGGTQQEKATAHYGELAISRGQKYRFQKYEVEERPAVINRQSGIVPRTGQPFL